MTVNIHVFFIIREKVCCLRTLSMTLVTGHRAYLFPIKKAY
jgi:hypothetical protein